MRILHIGKYYPPFAGGMENFCADVAEAAVRRGSRVAALVHHHERGRAFQIERRDGVEVLRAPLLGQWVFAPVSPSFGFHLWRTAKRFKPDVVHVHMPNVSAFWALLLPAVRRIPWVVQWQSDVLGASPDRRVKLLYPVYRIFERQLLRKSRAVIVASPGYLDSSEPLRPFFAKCVVVPLGIDEDRLSVPRGGPGQDSLLRVLCVGRLTYYKGHRVLIEAARLLSGRGISFRVDLVGEGEERPRLEKLIEAFGLQDRVTLHGRATEAELARLFAVSSIVCLPSIERTEAFGLVLVEAMAFSKPALVTDVPGSGMSWLVQDGKTGMVAAAGDSASLAEKLVFAFEHPQLMREMAINARRRFDAEFSIDAVATRLDALYRDVFARREKGADDE